MFEQYLLHPRQPLRKHSKVVNSAVWDLFACFRINRDFTVFVDNSVV